MTKSSKESSSDTTLVSIFGRLAGDFGDFEMVVFLFFFATLGFFFAALGFFFATLGGDFSGKGWETRGLLRTTGGDFSGEGLGFFAGDFFFGFEFGSGIWV